MPQVRASSSYNNVAVVTTVMSGVPVVSVVSGVVSRTNGRALCRRHLFCPMLIGPGTGGPRITALAGVVRVARLTTCRNVG